MVRSDFTKAMVNDSYPWFIEGYNLHPTVYDKLFANKPMGDHEGSYVQETSAISLGKWDEIEENESLQSQSVTEGFTVYGKPRDFGNTLKMSKSLISDHAKVKHLLREYAGSKGESYYQTLEDHYSTFFNQGGITTGNRVFNATSTAAGMTDPSGNGVYDGTAASPMPLFNLSGNERSSKGGGTYYNGIASALTESSLEDLWLRMTSTNNRNERDDIVALMPDTLLVPPALMFTAKKILESEKTPGNANNAINPLKGILNLVVWQFLSDSDAWFLGCSKKGLKAISRQKPVIDFFYDEDERIYKFVMDARFGGYVQNWRFWAGSNFSDS